MCIIGVHIIYITPKLFQFRKRVGSSSGSFWDYLVKGQRILRIQGTTTWTTAIECHRGCRVKNSTRYRPYPIDSPLTLSGITFNLTLQLSPARMSTQRAVSEIANQTLLTFCDDNVQFLYAIMHGTDSSRFPEHSAMVTGSSTT